MSTIYNRRRGAAANVMRNPRHCHFCVRLADTASQLCSDHRLRGPSVEGPAGRRLRLIHQANQSAEAARMKGTSHVRLPAYLKARRRRLKALAASRAKKSLRSLLNPWAK